MTHTLSSAGAPAHSSRAGAASRASLASRVASLAYGTATYALFLGTFLYVIGFVAGRFVPKHIDSGAAAPWKEALLVNGGFLALFAIQHTIMARPAFKKRWTKIVPEPMERSIFVLCASSILLLLFWQWRPNRAVIWEIDQPALEVLLIGVSLAGWAILFISSFLIDHFDLFGLRQVTLYLRGRDYTPPRFVERSLYKKIRHPLMTGVLLGVWATPLMTLGHLVLAAGLTAYILVGVRFEERDLIKAHGEAYEAYRQRTRKFFPIPGPRNLAPVGAKKTEGQGTA